MDSVLDPPPLSVSGKVFILGEYAALVGVPVLVSSVSPRFSLTPGSDMKHAFHPESPAGRLAHEMGDLSGVWSDPYLGCGGFGASTAQFALLAYRSGIRDAVTAWEKYRSLTLSDGTHAPSGADLIAQWAGGTVIWDRRRKSISRQNIPDSFHFLLFSASHLTGRKVSTHTHLSAMQSKDFSKLEGILADGIEAFSSGENHIFGRLMTEYAEELSRLGLENEGAYADRAALERVAGVLGVKGCGACLSDAVLVLMAPGSDSKAVIRAAQDRGLRFVSDQIGQEPGIGPVIKIPEGKSS